MLTSDSEQDLGLVITGMRVSRALLLERSRGSQEWVDLACLSIVLFAGRKYLDFTS
jgi:hypothetical protein